MKLTAFFKQTITILIVIAMLFLNSGMALAEIALPDFHRKGTITVTMKSGENIIHGGEIALYKVADVFDDDGKVGFVLTEQFKNCKVSLEDIHHSELPVNLSKYVIKHNIDGRIKNIDANGVVSFGDLSAGLYLIYQIAEGAENYVCQPFLVEVPYYDTETEKWEYDIKASPKVAPDEPTTWPDNPDNPDNPDYPDYPDYTNPDDNTPEYPDDYVPTTPDEPKLPHTGQHNLPVPILVVTGVLLIIIGMVLYHEKGKKK